MQPRSSLELARTHTRASTWLACTARAALCLPSSQRACPQWDNKGRKIRYLPAGKPDAAQQTQQNG